MKRIFQFVTFFFLLLSFLSLLAGWPTTPDSALFVDFGLYPYLAIDETDESITVIYIRDADRLWAKKYDRYGDPLWGGNAVVLADTNHIFGLNLSNLGNQWGAVVSDDSGGAIITWKDFRHSTFDDGQPINNEIYLQRVDVNGQVRYGTNGRRISGPVSDGWNEWGDMKPDYHGGFVVAFDNDSSSTTSVLKRFNINGNLIWETYFTGAYIDIPATDREGNIFVNTIQSLPGTRHKLDLSGNSLWADTLGGIIPDDISYPVGGAFSDGYGGAIGTRWEWPNIVRINRVDSNGQFVFGNSGVTWTGTPSLFYEPDSVGGIYVNWNSFNGSFFTNYVQRVKINGEISWALGGIITCGDSSCLGTRGIVSDNRGGAISMWAEGLGLPIKSFYAQNIDSSGNFLWDSSGVEVHSTQDNPIFVGPVRYLYSDLRGGAIITWIEQGQGLRIMLKQISKYGNLGEVLTSIDDSRTKNIPGRSELFQNYPNPFNNSTTIRYRLHRTGLVTLKIFNVLGEEVQTLLNGFQYAGEYRIHFDASKFSSGIYIYQLKTSTSIFSKKMLYIK